MRDLLKAYSDEIAAPNPRSLEVTISRYVLEHGKLFVPTNRPKGLRKRADKKCFYNAQDTVLRDRAKFYCEGYATSSSGFGIIHHGWVSNDGEHAIEMTWRTPGEAYFGIEYTAQQVAALWIAERAGGSMLSPTIFRG
jgi:hypothetical protein